MIKNINFAFILLILLNACKKEKDAITSNIMIHGNVRNNCTGKGFANVEVKFLTMKGNTTSISTTTDSNGNFTFSGIEMHSSSKYSYALNIERHSYYDYTFDGVGPYEINLGNVNNFQQFGTSASFKIINFYLPNDTFINPPDSVALELEQKTLHYYEPWRVWQVNENMIKWTNIDNNTILNIGNYPMGLWHITIDKTKAGVHSIINDSIYLDMGATASYTIPW